MQHGNHGMILFVHTAECMCMYGKVEEILMRSRICVNNYRFEQDAHCPTGIQDHTLDLQKRAGPDCMKSVL